MAPITKGHAAAPEFLSRRIFLGSLATASAAVLTGCGRAAEPQPLPSGSASTLTSGITVRKPQADAKRLVVYRDPSCGCCEAWAQLAVKAGFATSVIDRPDMPEIKRRHGVPAELASCHTGVVGGYTLEGHVPFDAVARLLNNKPPQIRGLAVPGMPRGSPGMEMPDGSKDPFEVWAFDDRGGIAKFRV